MDNVYDRYLLWLCELINLQSGSYDKLIQELYHIPFVWVLVLDENRAKDGLILRAGCPYINESFSNIDINKDDCCSVLEAIIGLAQRMNYILDDECLGDRTRIWFWEMIFNLGLKEYTDDVISLDYNKLSEVYEKCSRWMDRKFTYGGVGSVFPLSNPHRDQRKEPLINQMNDYILENYMYEDELL